jgi:hypothetical protein
LAKADWNNTTLVKNHAEEVVAVAAESDDIRMEDVLGAGTRKRPSAIVEDADELHAETRRF